MRTGPGSRLPTSVAVAALTGGLILSSPAFATDPAPTPAIAGPVVPAGGRMPSGAAGADFAAAIPSADTRQVADWVIRSGDNDGMPFAIVDKTEATLFLFAPDGVLRATTPVLLGLARG